MDNHELLKRIAELEAELKESEERNSALASGQCTEGGPWGDDGGTPYCKYRNRTVTARSALHSLAKELAPTAIDTVAWRIGFCDGFQLAEKTQGIGLEGFDKDSD